MKSYRVLLAVVIGAGLLAAAAALAVVGGDDGTDPQDTAPPSSTVATCDDGAAPGDWVEGTDAQVHADDCTPTDAITASDCPMAVPEDEGLDPFYVQYCDVRGIPLVASAEVDADVLRHGARQLWTMLAARPDIAEELAASTVRVGIMGTGEVTLDMPEWSDLEPDFNERARGLGATLDRPLVGGAEENIACYPPGDIPTGDRYWGEDIFLHELAHTLTELGAYAVDPTFEGRLRTAYDAALDAGLWTDTYAATDEQEYFAEGAQSFFDANQAEDGWMHNHVDTRDELRSYDPALFALVAEVYGETTWRPRCPDGRTRVETRA